MTLSGSYLIVEEFWVIPFYDIAKVHWWFCALAYAQLC